MTMATERVFFLRLTFQSTRGKERGWHDDFFVRIQEKAIPPMVELGVLL